MSVNLTLIWKCYNRRTRGSKHSFCDAKTLVGGAATATPKPPEETGARMGDDGEQSRTGRPRKARDEARSASIPPLRVTVAELAFIQEQAARAGLSLSEFCRRVILRKRIPPAITNTDEAALADLNRIGVNLNQLARRANASGRIPPHLAEVLAEVKAAIERIAERGA